uniref:Uncharacterized protein n=1 Tax=viral metagenome TaxID=1070528 RepID=A0A6C0HZ57_9ZZZZ
MSAHVEPSLLERTISVPNHKQQYNNCFAHSMARCVVRTLQVLRVINPKFSYHFYKLFVLIVSMKFGCESKKGVVGTQAFEYLLKFLKGKKTQPKLFLIKDDCRPFGEMDEMVSRMYNHQCLGHPILGLVPLGDGVDPFTDEDKEQFLHRLNSVLPYIEIIQEDYDFYFYNEKEGYIVNPSKLTLDSLQRGLQPELGFTIPSDIKLLSKPVIPQCEPDGGHGITLKEWKHQQMIFKNSWGKGSDIKIKSSNLAYISCYDSDNRIELLTFTHVIYTDDVFQLDFLRDLPRELMDKNRDPVKSLTDFTFDEISERTGNVDYAYGKMSEQAMDYLISKKLVSLIHIVKFYMYSGESKDSPEHKYVNHILFNKIMATYGPENVNWQDEKGNTALHYAFKSIVDETSIPYVVETLLKAGANPRIKNGVLNDKFDAFDLNQDRTLITSNSVRKKISSILMKMTKISSKPKRKTKINKSLSPPKNRQTLRRTFSH